MNLNKKRKVTHECRVFNKDWTYNYFFTDVGEKAICLLCQDTVAVFKEYNLKRHYQSKHKDYGQNLSQAELKNRADEMVKRLKQQQTVLFRQSNIQEAATTASLMVAHMLAKHNKSFSDGEFIKECMLKIANVVCPEVKNKLESVSLSRRTVVRRIDAISENLQDQLLQSSRSFQWFSLALDESTDIQDTAQLLIFIRGVDSQFTVTEELLSMESLKASTADQDLFDCLQNCFVRTSLPWNKLASITTNGAPVQNTE